MVLISLPIPAANFSPNLILKRRITNEEIEANANNKVTNIMTCLTLEMNPIDNK